MKKLINPNTYWWSRIKQISDTYVSEIRSKHGCLDEADIINPDIIIEMMIEEKMLKISDSIEELMYILIPEDVKEKQK